MTEDWERELDQVRSKVSSLESQWEEERGSLKYDYSVLDSRVDSVRDDVDVLKRDDIRMAKRVGEVEELLAAVTQQVAWLERRVRGQAGEEPADLDAVDDRARALCDAVRRLHEERDMLLTPPQREALRKEVAAHDKQLQQLDQARKHMIAASKELARVPVESAEHTTAAIRFRQARHTIDTMVPEQQDRAARRARDAAQELAEDTEAATEAGPVLQAGRRALAQLETRVRTCIAKDVAAGRLLPVWFTTVFGPLPDRKDPGAWLEDATDAVIYRMVYSVDDPVLLLGERPNEDLHSAQWDRYTKLQPSLKKWSG